MTETYRLDGDLLETESDELRLARVPSPDALLAGRRGRFARTRWRVLEITRVDRMPTSRTLGFYSSRRRLLHALDRAGFRTTKDATTAIRRFDARKDL